MSPIACGAGAPARERLVARADRAKASAILAAIIRSFAVLAAALREIFDESAYQRFLDRSRLESSPNAYAIFLQENEQAKSRRPRCC
jgi:hypothetical protein